MAGAGLAHGRKTVQREQILGILRGWAIGACMDDPANRWLSVCHRAARVTARKPTSSRARHATKNLLYPLLLSPLPWVWLLPLPWLLPIPGLLPLAGLSPISGIVPAVGV